ncbi:hypothetical protein KP509_18G057600 [Ceratopteris richardii]|uniref:RING-type E3 ubiquitin transferase n=1 Tax=Ceratopteris richardii TaxID=49495 RepID=A0A8T2SUG0_CERRI|nr:hypothetical protein KP509_18G057600 [Ceratopteris richardii]
MTLRIFSAVIVVLALFLRPIHARVCNTTGTLSCVSSPRFEQRENNLAVGLDTNATAQNATTMPSADQTMAPFLYGSTSSFLVLLMCALCFMFIFILPLYIRRRCMNSGNPGNAVNHGVPNLSSSLEQQHVRNSIIVSSLPTVRYSKQRQLSDSVAMKYRIFSAECPVCLTAFEEGEELRILPACGHWYHKDCIDMWVFSHETCPLCRCIIGEKAASDGIRQAEPNLHTHIPGHMV